MRRMNSSIKLLMYVVLVMSTSSCSVFSTGLAWAQLGQYTPEEWKLVRNPKWHEYEHEAREALGKERYGLAKENYHRMVDEATRLNALEAIIDVDLSYPIYINLGCYDKATKAIWRDYQNHKKLMSPADAKQYYLRLGSVLVEQGKYDDALNCFSQFSIEVDSKGKDYGKIDGNRFAFGLFAAVGDCYVHKGDYVVAGKYYQAYADMAKGSDSFLVKAKADIDLGINFYYSGDDLHASEAINAALFLLPKEAPETIDEIIQCRIMLGKIEEHRAAYENAYKYYHDALNTLIHYNPNNNMVRRANIKNLMGDFLLRQGKIQESEQTYLEALRLRQTTETTTHPNCADSYKGFADVTASKGELTSATFQATKALEILDASVVPTHPRTAQELVALASIYILSGHPERTAPLNTRLDTILQKPLGPWKEDFLDTTAFYAGLLRKVGKNTEADRLTRLHDQQQAKR